MMNRNSYEEAEPRTTVVDHMPTVCWTPAGLVETTHVSPAEITRIEERREASHAEPAPLCLFGFAVGTILVGLDGAGVFPAAALVGAIPVVLVLAGIAQFIGGLISFNRGSTFGGTAFCSYGAFNAFAATYLWMQHLGFIGTPMTASPMFALVLYCFGFISFVLAIAALAHNVGYTMTLAALVPGYALSGLPYQGVGGTPGHIGGWFLVLAALLAFYCGSAVLINSAWRRQVVPLGNLRRS